MFPKSTNRVSWWGAESEIRWRYFRTVLGSNSWWPDRWYSFRREVLLQLVKSVSFHNHPLPHQTNPSLRGWFRVRQVGSKSKVTSFGPLLPRPDPRDRQKGTDFLLPRRTLPFKGSVLVLKSPISSLQSFTVPTVCSRPSDLPLSTVLLNSGAM